MIYETKTLPSGVVIENRPKADQKYRWWIKDTPMLHNEGDPAVEYKNGGKYWYQHGKCHRLDGPATEHPDGDKFYYINEISYEEEDYWNHPEVKKYLYLQEHPELEAFI